MTTTAPAPAGRKARCRMTNTTSDRCSNEAIDPDPNAPQICVRHALEGVQLLAAAGAIQYTVGITTAPRRTA